MEDVTGKSWGKLTAVKFMGWRSFNSGKRHQLWEFICACGRRSVTSLNNVKTGHTVSCGCFLNQRRAESHTIHGGSVGETPEHLYIVWFGMKQRCEDVNCRLYPRWGGRGIKVLWTDYATFRADMLPTYQSGLQIERKDNDGHYCKENCTWATPKQQALNRRSNVRLAFNGVCQSVSVWEDHLGFRRGTLAARIKRGWSVERTLTTPLVEA